MPIRSSPAPCRRAIRPGWRIAGPPSPPASRPSHGGMSSFVAASASRATSRGPPDARTPHEPRNPCRKARRALHGAIDELVDQHEKPRIKLRLVRSAAESDTISVTPTLLSASMLARELISQGECDDPVRGAAGRRIRRPCNRPMRIVSEGAPHGEAMSCSSSSVRPGRSYRPDPDDAEHVPRPDRSRPCCSPRSDGHDGSPAGARVNEKARRSGACPMRFLRSGVRMLGRRLQMRFFESRAAGPARSAGAS